MAVIVELDYKNQMPINKGYLRMQYAPQPFKKEKTVHLIFDFWYSDESYQKAKVSGNDDDALGKRFLTVDIIASQSRNREEGKDPHRSPDGGIKLTLVCPDVVRFWGGDPGEESIFTPEEFAKIPGGDSYSLAWEICKKSKIFREQFKSMKDESQN